MDLSQLPESIVKIEPEKMRTLCGYLFYKREDGFLSFADNEYIECKYKWGDFLIRANYGYWFYHVSGKTAHEAIEEFIEKVYT